MIYFVDEDYSQIKPFAFELAMRGHEVETLADADAAFLRLHKIKVEAVDLVIIDIMLAANPDPVRSKFTRDRTHNFKVTGLILLEELMQHNAAVFPAKSLFFSMASSRDLIRKIRGFCEKNNVQYLDKDSFNTCYDFGEKIDEILGKIK